MSEVRTGGWSTRRSAEWRKKSMDSSRYFGALVDHYRRCWSSSYNQPEFHQGPVDQLPAGFRVLEFPPWGDRKMWTYCTVCMSDTPDDSPLELHLFSRSQDASLVELLFAIGHYHHNSRRLGLNDTVNFGRPWLSGSPCEHGLISLPYLDGPELEWLSVGMKNTRFLWVIPVTETEVRFARKFGVQALEERFEAGRFDYLDPLRRAAV